ncbi:MAG: hypothetical protein ACSLE0_08175 [Chitinophagaceae bacterium]
MKKENKIIDLIINLAKFVFSEIEFNRFLSLIKLKLFNQMRIFVEEKLEYLETKLIISKNDTVLEAQLSKCRELDTVVTDLYIDSAVIIT